MADVSVTPEHLDKLATAQDQASTQAGTAGAAASNLETEVWVSHGVVSAASNLAFTKAVGARHSTAEAMKKSSTDLAAKLRTAKKVYQTTDEQTGQNLNKQVLDR